MEENWYIVLGLEFSPNPVTDERIIEEKIEQKRKEWARKANDLNHGAEYRRYTQMLPLIRKEMIGPENKRQMLIHEACEKTYGAIDDILRQLMKQEVGKDVIMNIAQKQNVPESVVRQRATQMGINVVSKGLSDYQYLYNEYYKAKPQNADKYNGMKIYQDFFGVKSLYEFLYSDVEINKEATLSSNRLKSRAEDRKRNEFYKNDSISGAGSKLCGYCQEIFGSEEERKKYDRYLKYYRCKEVLDSLKDIYEMTGEISKSVFENAIERLQAIGLEKKKATDVITAFCKVEKMPIQIVINIVQEKKQNPISPPKQVIQENTYQTPNDSQRRQKDNSETNSLVSSIIVLLLLGGVIYGGTRLFSWINGEEEEKTPNPTAYVVQSQPSHENEQNNEKKENSPMSVEWKWTEMILNNAVDAFLNNNANWDESERNYLITSELIDKLRMNDDWNSGIFDKEEESVFRRFYKEKADDHEFRIENCRFDKSIANCTLYIQYTDFSRVIALADWYVVEETQNMESIEDEEWNGLYSNAVKKAFDELYLSSESVIELFFMRENDNCVLYEVDSVEILYDAITGNYRKSPDYEWVEEYMSSKQ